MTHTAPDWDPTITAWLISLTAAGRPETTRRLRHNQLTRCARWHEARGLGPWDATTDTLTGWLADQQWARETLVSHRAALQSFYRWAVATGRLVRSPADQLPRVSRASLSARPCPDEALHLALATPDRRTRLMLTLAARIGLRRGEISRMHTDDLCRDLVGWSILVHGKGARDRVLPLPRDLYEMIRAQQPASGWVFPGGSREGHLSPLWVGKLMSAALPGGWTAHTLRHRFATVTYAGTRDLLTVQQLLGHAQPSTTAGYVRLPDDSLRAALAYAA